jgi:acyltransferase
MMIQSMTRNQSIDAIKGVLIILVVAGHLFPGSVESDFGKWFIYSFHMPAFFFISGFLFSSRLLSKSWAWILTYIFGRLLFPWIVASFFYYTFIAEYAPFRLLYPWYHLWFVPALIIHYLLAAAILKSGGGRRDCLIIFLTVFLFFHFLKSLNLDYIWYFGDSRIYQFIPWFGLGLWARSAQAGRTMIECLSKGSPILLILGYLTSFHGFYSEWDIFWSGIPLAAGVVSVIYLVIIKNEFANNFLARVGCASVYIYLWHVALIWPFRTLSYPGKYLVVGLLIVVMTAVLMRLESSKIGILIRGYKPPA